MKKHALLAFCLACAGHLTAVPAQADANTDVQALLPLSLEELLDLTVSISTNTQQKLSKAPSVVSVITAEDIKATGTTDLMEILQSVPGIYVRRHAFGFKPLISMRGSNGFHVLLMVNGAPMRDLVWSSNIFWKGLPASMIERIEIIRGPGSVQFGSDASAGVINVITKTAGKINQSEAGVRAGSFDTQTAWLQHGTEWNGYDIGLTAEFSRTDGHRPYIRADGQKSPVSASLAPDHALYGYDSQDVRFSIAKGSWRLLADHMRHGDIHIGMTGASVLDPKTQASDSQTALALLYGNEAFAKDWGLNAELRYRDLDYTSGNGFYEYPAGYTCTTNCAFGLPAATYPNGILNQMRSAERRLNFEASALYTGFRNHAIRLGGGYVWQDLYLAEEQVNNVPVVFVPEENRKRKNRYVFVQDVWNFANDWELTAGGRYDEYSVFGGAFVPRAALVWQTSERLATKLIYGEAFRVPSFLELYMNTSATRPDPNLSPEKTRTTELAFVYQASGNLQLGLNLYRWMQSAPIVDSAGVYKKVAGHPINGIELEGRWHAAPGLHFSGNYTQRQQSYWPYASFYPLAQEEAYLRADWAFLPKWHWNLQANWIGKRAKSRTDTRDVLGAQTIADTTVRYVHDKRWEFAASIRNLFDTDVYDYGSSTSLPDHLPLPGRNFFAEIRYKF